jgi:hypothetical protein
VPGSTAFIIAGANLHSELASANSMLVFGLPPERR